VIVLLERNDEDSEAMSKGMWSVSKTKVGLECISRFNTASTYPVLFGVKYQWILLKVCQSHKQEVSNSNPVDVLNSIENDVDLGTNGGSQNPNSSNANTSGFLSGNAESSSTSNTPMVENFDKMERLIIEGKVTLVDDDGKPLKKVDYSDDHDSEDKVASTDDDMEKFLV
nr:hypothetical protein [Tanacetum cinerariifolium]